MNKAPPPPLLGAAPAAAKAQVDRFVRTGAPAKASKRRLQLYVTNEVSQSLAVYCAREHLALSDVGEEAIIAWLKVRGALET